MLRSGFPGLKKKTNQKKQQQQKHISDVKNKSRMVTKHRANQECKQHEHT